MFHVSRHGSHMKHVPLIAAMFAFHAWCSPASAQPAPPAPAQPPAAADAAQTAQGQPLKAIVTALKGSVQARASEQDKWITPKVNDVLDVGAEIRTGLASAIQLRIDPGHTITIDRLGVVKLLTLVKDKNTVKTDVGMKYGRTEYQVEVGGGLHDSRVHSPAATLVIRGSRVTVTDDALGSYATGEGKLTLLNNLRRTSVAFGGQGKATVTEDRPNAASVAVKQSTIDPLGAFIARTLAEGAMVEGEPGVGGSDYLAVVELQRLAKSLQGSGIGVANLPGPLDFSLVWFAPSTSNLNLSVTDPNGITISAQNPVGGVFPAQGVFNPPSGIGDDGIGGSGFEEVRFIEFFKRGTYTVNVTHAGGADATFFINAQQGITADPLTISPTPPSTLSAGQTVSVKVKTK
jgi:hypothetical protein